MIKFTTTIKKFEKKGEKTGWTYIPFSGKIANQLNSGSKVSFRVKGKLDGHPIAAKALLPMGGGEFILPIKSDIRKMIGKEKGDKVTVEVELDSKPLELSKDLMKCLKPEPEALKFFKAMPPSHQHYFSKWIEDAKTIDTKTKRITMTVVAMANKMMYNEMMRAYRDGTI
jgi:Domain of unknown function (DUF1905)/Bacteriocin-protection, YdeI or OmpD-Associated